MSGPDDISSDYALVPANSIDEGRLIDFAKTVWPDQGPHYRMLSSWWRRAEPHCAVAAVHQPTGAMAGLCGGRPCEWSIADRSLSAIAICDWYVAPDHAGKGLGKRLVQHFDTPERFLYAFSISGAAIANFKKLGWKGPYTSSIMVLPLPRLVGILLSLRAVSKDVEIYEQDIAAGKPLGELAAVLDYIEASRGHNAPAHMQRGAKDWSWRLSVCGEHRYRFCIARRKGVPVGYTVVRPIMPGRSRRLGKLKAAIIADLVAVGDDPSVLRTLARRAIKVTAELGAVIVLTATTTLAHRNALAAMGFISPGFPLIGRLLERRSPQFMWLPRDLASPLTADNMALTFADVAIDLDL